MAGLGEGGDALEVIQEWFGGTVRHVRTDDCHRVSSLIQQEWINVESHIKGGGAEEEIGLLLEVVRRSLFTLKHESILIFAESKKTVDRICETLRNADIKNLPYYSELGM